MPLLARALVTVGRLRRRRLRRGGERPREDLVRRYAPGRSFLDVGCMWNVHGGITFLAEEAGAKRVTGIDVMAPTPRFESEHARRSSDVRFVRGDVHDPATVAEAGRANWWWGITPSALRGMLAVAGLDVVELSDGPFHRTAICRPADIAK